MANTWLYFLPVISAAVGWLLSRLGLSLFWNELQSKQQALALQAGNYVASGFSFNDITTKLTSEEAVEKILPVADEHVEHFLRVKLPEAMPMLAMFISDKLVADMKAVFMNELKELFPTIIRQYLSNAQSTIAIDKMVAAKIGAADLHQLKNTLRSQWNKIALFGAFIGFVTALIQISLTLLA